MDELVADLRAERADLRSLVVDADLRTPVPADGWDVQDTLSHLIGVDDLMTVAVLDTAAFEAGFQVAATDVQGFLDDLVLSRRGLSREELLASWDSGFDGLLEAFAAVPEGGRVPWYGPPMALPSAVTARLMEYWAHGQDVADGLGVQRVPTARLRHVCHLGVRTRRFSYGNRGLVAPDGDVLVELTAPDGTTWAWGEGESSLRGSALDFCLLVTQRRHRDDLDLVATGTADSWLDVAQCFAGPAGEGRAAA